MPQTEQLDLHAGTLTTQLQEAEFDMVVDKREDATLGAHLVTLEVVMSNQDGAVLAKGPVEVQLPHP